jgi:hypothetical protein
MTCHPLGARNAVAMRVRSASRSDGSAANTVRTTSAPPLVAAAV